MHRKDIQGQNGSLWGLNMDEIALYTDQGKTKERFGGRGKEWGCRREEVNGSHNVKL